MTQHIKKSGSSKESKLLADIIDAHGGVMEVSKKLKISKQLVSIWKYKGYVPVSRVISIAKLLKIPAIALNFKGLKDFHPYPITWEEVKKDCYIALRNI